jgi:hypothetical protein
MHTGDCYLLLKDMNVAVVWYEQAIMSLKEALGLTWPEKVDEIEVRERRRGVMVTLLELHVLYM